MEKKESKGEGSLQDYFRDLDHHFIGLKKTSNDEFIYKSTDVLVQTTWELPVVVQWPDAVVNYEFSTKPGDIWFGILFVAATSSESEFQDNVEIEAVEELARVSSGSETIKGSFELQCEGVVFFLWDNTFDWSATKKVSYKIEVLEPSFTLPDKLRTGDSVPVLRETFESLNNNLNRLADAQDSLENNLANVKFLEDQIAKLSQKLSSKKTEADKAQFMLTEVEICLDRIEEFSLPLLSRTLNKNLTKHILGYLSNEPSVYSVCTYWKSLLDDKDGKSLSQSSEKRVKYPKIPKEEKDRLIFLLKNNLSKSQSRDEENYLHQNKYLSKSQSVATSEEEITLKVSQTGSQTEKQRPQILLSKDGELSDDSSNTISSLEKQASPNLEQRVRIKTRARDVIGEEGKEVNGSPMKGNYPSGQSFGKPKKLLSPPQEESPKETIKDADNMVSKSEEPSFKPKIVAERRPSGFGKQRSTKIPPGGIGNKKDHPHQGLPHVDSKLLENVQKIRSEQQLHSIMEYLQVGYAKIDKLSIEKRKIKKLIKAWNATYQKQFGKLPTSSERKGHLRELYEEYHKISLALKMKRQKLTDLMNKVGINEETYQEMKNSSNIHW